MQRLWIFIGFLALGLLAGCGSVSDLREKISSREQPRIRVYAAAPRATYEAAKRAAEEMGYRFVRGGPAQGELEGISKVSSSDTMSSSRQISLDVKFVATLDGGTELRLLFREINEGDSVRRAGTATATALRDTPQYEVFFRTVQQVLDAPKKP
jgi:hypothetical protein